MTWHWYAVPAAALVLWGVACIARRRPAPGFTLLLALRRKSGPAAFAQVSY